MLGYITFFIVANIVCVYSANDDLPSYFPRCHLDDPDLNACILKASDDVRDYIKKGVPELNIPAMDPLIVPEIKTQQGTNTLNYKVTVRNAKIKGLGDYQFSVFTYDPETLTYNGVATFKRISMESDYEIDGRILAAPIQGKGKLTADIKTESTGTLQAKGKLVTRNGKVHYDPGDVTLKLVLGDVDAKLDGLFDGNEQLAQATNNLLKENSKELIKEITPAIETVASEIAIRIISSINKKVPYNKVFPPSH